jgi:type IV pilus assembly protein PilQ
LPPCLPRPSDTVGGTLTLRLRDVPWDQALDIVLEARGLAKRVNGNVVLVAPAEELLRKHSPMPFGPPQPLPPEPVVTRAFPLEHARVDVVRKRIADRGMLSRHGSVAFDGRTNTLFVQDTEAVLHEVESFVRRLDVRPPADA